MKRPIITLAFLLTCAFAFAQVNDVEEVIAERTIGKANGFKVFVPKSTVKLLENGYKKWMKEYSAKTMRNKKTQEWEASEVNIPSMGEGKYAIYALFSETSEGGFVTTFLSAGDTYVTANTHPQEAIEWARLLKKFATDEAADVVESELTAAEKKLKDAGKVLEKLKKDKADYEKEIKACEEKIVDRKKKLEVNGQDQIAAKDAVTKKEAEVARVKAELEKYKD